MKKRLIDYFINRKSSQKDEVVKEKSAPTQSEVDAVVVEPTLHTVKTAIPLLPKETDVWVICGKGIGLRGETVGRIGSGLERKGYDLRYYYMVFRGLTKEILEFNFPDLDIDVEQFSRDNFLNAIREGLGLEISDTSILFIKYEGKTEPDLLGNEPEDCFSVFDASAPNAQEFMTKALAYIQSLKDLGDSHIMFSITRGESDSGLLFRDGDKVPDGLKLPLTPDEYFDEEMIKVASETYAGMSRLIMSGLSIDVIEGWIKHLSKPSRVVITEKFDIVLPDYKNKVVEMNQLPKALYLFFLKHDRAYAIYQMQDQKKEILAIYQKITNSTEQETIEQRIDSLVNPNGISFTEKCSLIRSAFSRCVPTRFAEDYFIQGPQGEAKRIKLDRNLVEWRVKI